MTVTRDVHFNEDQNLDWKNPQRTNGSINNEGAICELASCEEALKDPKWKNFNEGGDVNDSKKQNMGAS